MLLFLLVPTDAPENRESRDDTWVVTQVPDRAPPAQMNP